MFAMFVILSQSKIRVTAQRMRQKLDPETAERSYKWDGGL